MRRLKAPGLVFLASLIMTAAGSARAEENFYPDVQINGTVLQGLVARTPDKDPPLEPVKLVPPSPLNRIAGPASASLTGIEEKAEPVLPSAKPLRPVITSQKPATATGPQAFPVKTKSVTLGGLDPAATDPTNIAPVQLDAQTSKALNQAMSGRTPATPQTLSQNSNLPWRQAQPQKLYTSVPVPRPRPAKGMASAAFVEQARKNLVETYTIVKREGDRMPAVRKDRVVGEKLPAPRLSVADIAGDPLASRIVDMSPEEVAQALNTMAPAAGREQAHLARELSVVAKPRIVREHGQWTRRTETVAVAEVEKAPVPEVKPDMDITGVQNAAFPLPRKTPARKLPEKPAGLQDRKPASKDGVIMVGFTAGEIGLDGQATEQIDKSVIQALKNDPDTRIQIIAWASAADGKEGTARRTSLSRALSVRSYLISQGIDATRMDVRAMGVQTEAGGSPDKVDMILVQDKKS